MAKTAEKHMEKKPKAPNTVTFDYIKSTQFKSVHVDGALGGLTPNGHIHIALYCERPAIPRRTVQEIAPDGSLGDEVFGSRESRNSIVREMDMDAFLTLSVAKSIHDWLGARIKELQEQLLKDKID